MKVTFIGHASVLVESNGVSILSDPWWNGPCFGAQWWLHPEPCLTAVQQRRPDYIYISHGHHDHFHPSTLKLFDRQTTILVARDSDLGPAVQAMGFPVRAVAPDEECHLGSDVRCRIIPTHADDTLMTVTDGRETFVNANDALHACPTPVQDRFIEQLRRQHPRLDYLFCGYGVASHFPNCYVIPGKDREASAVRRQQHFNRSWARIVRGLEPRFGLPFAADVVFLDEDLFWANEPVHNAERPTSVFKQLHPASATTVIDVAPGFVVQDGTVVVDQQRRPITAAEVSQRLGDSHRRVNRHPEVSSDTFEQIVTLLRSNVERCRPFLATFPGDYRALIRLRGADAAIAVSKRGASIELSTVANARRGGYDVVYTTRAPYLRGSLTTPYGHEVLFVGSGGIFEYADTARLGEDLHRELAVMMRPAALCPPPRPTGLAARVQAGKRRIRSMLGAPAEDLYDIRVWTVFAEPGRR
jgi:hypothetical protein